MEKNGNRLLDNITVINDSKFKGIYISLNFFLDIKKEDISKYVLLAAILSKSSNKYRNQTEIEKKIFEMYGSSFDINVNKYGDLFCIEFCMEILNKKYIPNKVDMLDESLSFFNEIVYSPIFKDEELDEEFFEIEKDNLIKKVSSLKDEKALYAISKIENMLSKNTLFGSYLYGNEEDIIKIKKDKIKETYDEFLSSSKLEIYVSGNLDGYSDIQSNITKYFKIDNNERYNDFEYNKENNISQSILTLGLKIKEPSVSEYHKYMLYNMIFGGTPISKLFLNVREKNSLAYTVRSKYYRIKNYIVIYAGIDKKSYSVAKKLIIKQIEDMKDNISKEEFESSKRSLLSQVKEWQDSKINVTKIMITNNLIFKDIEESLDSLYCKIEKLTIDDIYDVAKKVYLSKVFLLGGEKDK